SELKDRLSPKASDLVKKSFEDLDEARLLDYHTHVAGTGARGTGAFVNLKMRTWRHPLHRLKFEVYLSAAGVKEEETADEQFVARLTELVRHAGHGGRHRLLAFDKNYNADGTVNLEKTEFYVPNEYVFSLAEQHADIFD